MRIKHTSFGSKNCYSVQLGGLWLGFSYNTCIAAAFVGQQVRRDNEWGPTTGQHMTLLGVRNDTVVSEQEMGYFVQNAMLQIGIHNAKQQLAA